jgi:hypothetical protein
VSLLVGNDIVRSPPGQFIIPPSIKILFVGEQFRLLGVNLLQLAKIENLHTVVVGLTADHDVALVTLDLTP